MTITIDRLAPGMNTMNKWHWSKRKTERDAWAILLREAVGSTVPKFDRCSITVTRYYARNPMDWDNLTSTMKLPMDAMKHVGIIPDDSPEYVTDLTVKQEKVATMRERRTEIKLEAT